jgi:hypothetical protein
MVNMWYVGVSCSFKTTLVEYFLETINMHQKQCAKVNKGLIVVMPLMT